MYPTLLPADATSSPRSSAFVFCIYCYGDNRDLHSFPTRRSSDLSLAGGLIQMVVSDHPHVTSVQLGLAATWTEAKRSEEHTSELQSHSDLVCRLLLEKKKQNAQSPTHPHDKATRTPKEP